MTKEEAAKILDPATSAEALAEIEYYGGFDGERAKLDAVNAACEIAVAALRAQGEAKNEPLMICDFCIYDPPSSFDGKPCCMCPAELKRKPEEEI